MTQVGPATEDNHQAASGIVPAVSAPEHPFGPKSNAAAGSRNPEVELRLLAEPEQLEELGLAPPIVLHARNKGTVRLIKATYYDTPSGALYRAGVTLRVCQTGKRFVQTLKILPRNGGEPLHRGEWEAPVATAAPDFQLLVPLVSRGLQDALAGEPLQPVFTTEVRRRRRNVELPTGNVEVAFDRGIVVARGKTVPIGEIELELKRGSPAALYDFALALNEFGPVRPAIRSSVECGFGLAFDALPAVHKPSPPLSGADLSVDDAFAAILQSGLSDVLANQAAAEDGRDPEGVHQLRVALRRLRCALGLLKSLAPSAALDGFRADARWVASSLGEARNWDVFVTGTLPEVSRECDFLGGFDLVRDAAEQCRARGYAVVRDALADRRCGRFQLALGAWIEQRGWRCDVSGDNLATLASPAVSFAGRVLARQHGKVVKRARNFKHLPAEARHELRLVVKKLRYAADFFLPLFGSQVSSKRYGQRLGKLQERLGRHNDAATTRNLLARLPVEGFPAEAHKAIGAVLGWQACSLACTEPDLRSAWRDFRRSTLPWSAV